MCSQHERQRHYEAIRDHVALLRQLRLDDMNEKIFPHALEHAERVALLAYALSCISDDELEGLRIVHNVNAEVRA